MSATTMAPVYAYAVIAGPGMVGSGKHAVEYCTDDRARALAYAARATRQYRDGMARHGGSSGQYVAVEWGQPRAATWYDDMRPRALTADASV